MPGSSTGIVAWWLRRDPHGVAFTRGLRAAIAGPAVFAFGLEVLDNPAFAGTAAFGAIAAVIFSDYGGDRWRRTLAYGWLAVVGAALLAWGTAVSTTEWAAVGSTFVVTAAVRFAGNLGPQTNASVSSLILAFVLGVLVPGPTSAIPDRMAGWLVGVAAAALVSVVIRPGRTSDHLDRTVTDASRALAAGVRAAADPTADRAAARAALAPVRDDLRSVLTMPLRAGGPGLHSVARRTMVDRLVRFAAILDRALGEPPVELADEIREYAEAVARMLECGADVLARRVDPHRLEAEFAEFHAVRDAVFGRLVASVEDRPDPDVVLAKLSGAFPVRAGGLYSEAFARNACLLVGAREVAVAEMADDDRVASDSHRASVVRARRFLGEHVQSASVWFRDALRAAGVTRVRVRITRPEGLALEDPKAQAWLAAALAPETDERAALAAIDARYNDVVRDVTLSLTPNAEAPSLAPLLAEIDRVLRDAEATQRCVTLLERELPPVLADDSVGRTEAPSYAGEFAAAHRYVQSIRARAALHAQQSARIARWLEAALTTEATENPEGAENPDESADTPAPQ